LGPSSTPQAAEVCGVYRDPTAKPFAWTYTGKLLAA